MKRSKILHTFSARLTLNYLQHTESLYFSRVHYSISFP